MSELLRRGADDKDGSSVRALLRGVPPSRAMTSEERARSKARLARHVAIAAVAGGVSWIPGAAFGAGLGLIVGAATLFAPDPFVRAAPPQAPVSTVAVRAGSPSIPDEIVPPAPSVRASAEPQAAAPRAVTTTPVATSSAEPQAPGDALAEEAALLDRARAALAGAPAQALSLTEEHAARFPRGKLGIEREMVAIDALRRLGRTSEARARGEAVLSRARGSLYEERIRKVVESAR